MNIPSTSDPLAWIAPELAGLEQQGLRRRLSTRTGGQACRILLEGRELVNFSSNDYLALASDPRLTQAVAAAAGQEGWGSGASPLITGHSQIHEQLERRLAEFEGTEAALVFSSGFAANSGTIAALVGSGEVVFTDRKNHASLLDGCRLSRADVRTYPHGDWTRLEHLLGAAGKYRRRLIVTDSLFSMDGDLAPARGTARFGLAIRGDALGGRSPCHRRVWPARTRGGRASGRGGTDSRASGNA